MSYSFRVQFDRRGRGGKEWAGGEGVGRGERSGPGGRSRPGGISLLYVIYPYLQDFLFDFFKALSGDGTLPITEALQLLITQRHFGNSFPAIKVSN